MAALENSSSNSLTVSAIPGAEYSIDGGETWHPCDERQLVEDRQGEMLLVRIAATDDSFKSDACTVTVPVRGEAPVLTIDNATEYMDSTAAMEYSKDNGETWIPCLDNMALSDLTGASLLMIEKDIPIDCVLYAETGMDFPEMTEHIAKLDDLLYRERGIHITTLRHPKGFEWLMFDVPQQQKRAIERAQFGPGPLGQFKKGWSVEQLEKRFAQEEKRQD